MPLQYISEFWDLPELKITKCIPSEREIHLHAKPQEDVQSCPCCSTNEGVQRKGSNGYRRIRHLSVFAKKTIIHVPSIRMYCTGCKLGFVWCYSFVQPKRRYSCAFARQTAEQALGSTSTHSAVIQEAPPSTVSRMHREWLEAESSRLMEKAWQQALHAPQLILGIDDFAIKKGIRYNTGIHDLRGGTLLDICPGRTWEELKEYAATHPSFSKLKPYAVVMDFAPAYHAFIRECFPQALRVVDHFHVHSCVIESMQEVRKTVQHTLKSRASKQLKAQHRLLNPPFEQLTKKSQDDLKVLLRYSPLLRQAWEWKEAFNRWYHCAPSYEVALLWYEQWCRQGEQIPHRQVQITMRTMRSKREVITNYHRCRWTNAAIEGRHNRIKAYERRHYFTRNAISYKAGILVECNLCRLTR